MFETVPMVHFLRELKRREEDVERNRGPIGGLVRGVAGVGPPHPAQMRTARPPRLWDVWQSTDEQGRPLSTFERHRQSLFAADSRVDEGEVKQFTHDRLYGRWSVEPKEIVERLSYTPLEERAQDAGLRKYSYSQQVAILREAYRQRPSPPDGVTGYMQYWLQSDKRKESGPRKLFEKLKRLKPEERAAALPRDWADWSERGRAAISRALERYDLSPQSRINGFIDELITKERLAAEKYNREHPVQHGVLGVPLTFSRNILPAIGAKTPTTGSGNLVTDILHLLGGVDESNLWDQMWREELSKRSIPELMAVYQQLGRGALGPDWERMRNNVARRHSPLMQVGEALSKQGWGLGSDLTTYTGLGGRNLVTSGLKNAPKTLQGAVNVGSKAGRIGFAGAGAKNAYHALTDPHATPVERMTGGLFGALAAAVPALEEGRAFAQTKPTSPLYRALESAERSMGRQLAAGRRMGRQAGSTNLPYLMALGAVKAFKRVVTFAEWAKAVEAESGPVDRAVLQQVWDKLRQNGVVAGQTANRSGGHPASIDPNRHGPNTARLTASVEQTGRTGEYSLGEPVYAQTPRKPTPDGEEPPRPIEGVVVGYTSDKRVVIQTLSGRPVMLHPKYVWRTSELPKVQSRPVPMSPHPMVPDLLRAYDYARANPGGPRRTVEWDVVGREEAARIRESTAGPGREGIDVNGLPHVVDSDYMAHIEAEHGLFGEKSPDQIPMTREDWNLIPWVVKHADYIWLSKKTSKRGSNPVIVYQKRVNGHMLVAEEARRAGPEGKPDELAIVSAYKTPTPAAYRTGQAGIGKPKKYRSSNR